MTFDDSAIRVVGVKGNCGLLHDSVDEWRKCDLCRSPPPAAPMRDWIVGPIAQEEPETVPGIVPAAIGAVVFLAIAVYWFVGNMSWT